MLSDKTDDDTYVFWYATPSKDSREAFSTLIASWLRAGVLPRQGTPLEIARRTTGAAMQIHQHPPPRTAQDVDKIFTDYAGAQIPHVEALADLFLAGTAVRVRLLFEYIGEDELTPPRVDPRRDFMMGSLYLPLYWRERAKGYSEGDPGDAAANIEDALADRYLKPIAEQTAPLAGFSGPEHDNIRWRFSESELKGQLPPRLSELARYATYLSPTQVGAVGLAHFERLAHVFDWLHEKEARLRPMCRLCTHGGVILSRWPGPLDREPKFAALLAPEDRDSFNRIREALTAPAAR
jgi:hypothetical protein